jgi:signal transduction histidine kinase/CheY-like chemotaxis protein
MDSIRTFLPVWSPRQRAAAAVTFVAYLIAAQLSFHFFTSPAVIVPTSGIALAALVLEGIALWPAIYIAALLSLLLSGTSFIYLLILPVAQTLQPVVGAYVLKVFTFDPKVHQLRDMFMLIAVALTTSLIVPTLGILAGELSGNLSAMGVTWSGWWTGHILSLLVVAPFLIRWLGDPFFRRPWIQTVETVSVFIVLIILDYILGWTTVGQVGGISVIYFLLVPLFWIAIRLGPRFTFAALFVTTAFIMGGAFYSHVPLGTSTLGVRLFQLEIFLNIIAVIFYIIAGLQEERAEAIKSLHSYIDRLEEALNRLSLQDRAKNDFIAILAHELRNPLAPVVSALELLKVNGSYTGEEAQTLDLMDDRLKTIQRLLDDLLDVSRISRSKLRIKKEPVDLRTIIEHSIQAIDRNIKNRQQTLVIDVPHEPMILDADAVRIEQIVSNLLTNATKFTNEGGRIVISAKREGDSAIVSVQDNGIGIDPQMLGRIFESFLQLETGEHKGEGLGIGLSLTQKLVEMHGGTIEAKSEGINKGSEFVVHLPLLPAYAHTPVVEKRRPVAQKSPSSSLNRSVLVVDDNVSAAQGIGRLLEHKGYSVNYAYTGAEAKEKALSEKPNSIVLDIGLPDTDGYEVARMLRLGLGFTGTLIALTGYGQEEDKARAFEAGFDHHLTKPVSIADLEAVLSSA